VAAAANGGGSGDYWTSTAGIHDDITYGNMLYNTDKVLKSLY